MAVVVWDPLFEFNIPAIDEQHKQIVNMMNMIVEKLASGEIDEDVKIKCQEALVYVANHFSDEEKLLDDIKYPALDIQKEMHKEIMAKLQDAKKEIDIGEDIISKGIVEELQEIVKKHIFVEDRKYSYFYHKGMMPPGV